MTKIYDVKPLFAKWVPFKALENAPELFSSVEVDTGGYGIIWNDDLDLSCDELFENGKTVKTPFDGLMAFTDATQLWGLNESTLRKAIAYGKLVNGVDACNETGGRAAENEMLTLPMAKARGLTLRLPMNLSR